MIPQSTLYQLIEVRLADRTLADYVAAGLSARKSWRTIAQDIEDETGCKVAWETLRGWFKDRIQVQVEVKIS